MRLAPWFLAAAVALSAGPAVAAESVPSWKKTRDAVVVKLLAHAKSCKAKACVRESRAAYESVVALDPENAEARKALDHERKKDGRWTAPAAPRLPDSPPKLVEEVEAARKAIVEPFVLKALEVATAADTPAEVREMAAEDASAADPRNPLAKKANREVEDKGVWRLEETVVARARHAELAETFRVKFDATKALVLEPATEGEVEILGTGALGAQSHFGRVTGAAANVETADVGRLQPGLEALYRKAVGDPRPLRRMKVVLFPDPSAGIAAIQKDQRFDAGAKDLAQRLGATWVPGTLDYWVYGQTPEGRRETAMRGAVGTWLFWAHQVDAKKGWALEGFNHWFSEMTLGTHKVCYFRPSEYAGSPILSALSDQLRAENANWMQIASDLAASEAWPGVRSILAKDVNNLGPEGLLTAYVLSRYVLEAKPGVAADVLTAVGQSEQPDLWMGRLLGATPEGLDRRIRRWTAEVIASTPSAPPPQAPAPPAPPPAPKPPAPPAK